MRAATVLIGFFVFSGSALAAETQDKQPAAQKIVVAAANLKQGIPVLASKAKASVSRRAPVVDEGDSRLNDYALERSCCN
jgi:hypothetical protein